LVGVVFAATANAQTHSFVRNVNVSALEAGVRAACEQAGCEADARHLDIVFALMTSHFGADPGHAEGLRTIARELTRTFSSAGDRAAVAGWEMDLWYLSPTVTLNEPKPDGRAGQVGKLLPTAPMTASRGGHDTERALCSLWRNLPAHVDPASAVIIMLATEEASMLPPGGGDGKLMGLNAPEYRSLLDQVVRRPPIRLGFEACAAQRNDAWKARTATAVVVVPRRLVGRPGDVHRGGSAPPVLHRREASVAAVRSVWHWLIIAVVLIVVAVATWYAVAHGRRSRGGRRPTEITLGQRTFGIEAAGAPVEYRIVSEGASAPGETDVVADTVSGDLPGILLARVRYEPKEGLILDPEPVVTTTTIDGTEATGARKLPAGKYVVNMRGRVQTDPDLPPERFVARLQIVVK